MQVDQFEHISDFVRCYGTLTWNLAKVMTPSKDMPHVFTTYLPREAKKSRSGQASWSLSEFDGFRDQVEAKVQLNSFQIPTDGVPFDICAIE